MDEFLENIRKALAKKAIKDRTPWPTVKDKEPIVFVHEEEDYKITCTVQNSYTEDSITVRVVDIYGYHDVVQYRKYDETVDLFFKQVEKAVRDNFSKTIILDQFGTDPITLKFESKQPMLFGVNSGDKESDVAFMKAVNKTIRGISLSESTISLTFTDGTCLYMGDGGPYCCEERWISTDDELSIFIGSQLYRVEVKEGGFVADGGCHEVAFLDVTTSKGVFTMATHNDHNGCYSGFNLTCEFIEARN